MSATEGATTSLQALKQEIPNRFFAPWGSMTFHLHLWLGVVACGGLGIWNALYQGRWIDLKFEDIAAALYTYFPAIVITALLKLQQEGQDYWKSFGLFSALPFTVIFFFSTASTVMWFRFVCACIGALLSIVFWCIANGLEECFRDLKPEAATPEPTKRLKGNSDGWQK